MNVTDFVNYVDGNGKEHTAMVTEVHAPKNDNEVESVNLFVFDYASTVENVIASEYVTSDVNCYSMLT